MFQNFTGYAYNIFDLVQKSLNFSYTFIQSVDGTYGSPNGTGWTGLVGMVARKEVDFIINGLAVVYDRAMVRHGQLLFKVGGFRYFIKFLYK